MGVSVTSLQSRFQVCGEVLDQDVQGECVLLHLGSESYFSLNATGTLVWRCLKEGRTLGETVSTLVAVHAVDDETAEGDVSALIGVLVDAGLLSPLD